MIWCCRNRIVVITAFQAESWHAKTDTCVPPELIPEFSVSEFCIPEFSKSSYLPHSMSSIPHIYSILHALDWVSWPGTCLMYRMDFCCKFSLGIRVLSSTTPQTLKTLTHSHHTEVPNKTKRNGRTKRQLRISTLDTAPPPGPALRHIYIQVSTPWGRLFHTRDRLLCPLNLPRSPKGGG